MKKRLDVIISEKGLVSSRAKAAELIKRGFVLVEDKVAAKPAAAFEDTVPIEITSNLPFVSRGGEKLEAALKSFNIEVKDKVCIDIGSSTGGFTDCLLSHDAQKVFAIDVGTEQMEESLRKNPRVTLMENTDIRTAHIPEKADLVVVDVSFISVTKIIDVIPSITKSKADVVILIKPQFEVGRENLNRNGIVISEDIRKKAIDSVVAAAEIENFKLISVIDSPIVGGSGNKEYLAHFLRTQLCE